MFRIHLLERRQHHHRIAIKFVCIILLLKKAKVTEIQVIFKNFKERGMLVWSERRKWATVVDMQEFTRTGTVTMVRIRLLRTLTNQARNTVSMIKGTRKFQASSIVLGKDGVGSSTTKVAKATVPKVGSQRK